MIYPTCGTCYYFAQSNGIHGECRISPDFIARTKSEWCGQHPDFGNLEPVAETIEPEPPPIVAPEPAATPEPIAPVEPAPPPPPTTKTANVKRA